MKRAELFGKEYISQYVLMEAKRINHDFIYKNYCADMLLTIARCFGATIEDRYYDLVQPAKPEQNADDVKQKFIEGMRKAYGKE